MSGRLRELKNKGKFQFDIPKSGRGRGRGRLRGRLLTRAFHYKDEVTVQSGFQRELVAYESGHKYSVLTKTFEQTKQTGELPKHFFTWVNLLVFVHGVTKIQTTKLSILHRFYFHDALEQLKTYVHTNFRLKRFLGFELEHA